MKQLSVIVAILFASIFIIDQVSGGPVSKRDADESMMDSVKDMVSGMPVVGEYMKEGIQMVEDAWNKAQQMTNGGFGRMLGGAFPCTADLKKGIECTGVSAKSDMSELAETMMQPIPSLVLPGFIKSLIVSFIKVSLVPMMDTMLGGVKTS